MVDECLQLHDRIFCLNTIFSYCYWIVLYLFDWVRVYVIVLALIWLSTVHYLQVNWYVCVWHDNCLGSQTPIGLLVKSNRKGLGRGDWWTICTVYCLIHYLLFFHWMRFIRFSILEYYHHYYYWNLGPVGLDWWMEIGVKWCSTGLVIVLL